MIAIPSGTRERGTVRSGEWELDSHGQSEHCSHGVKNATFLTNDMVLVAGGKDTNSGILTRAQNCIIRSAGAGLSPAA